MRQQSNYVLNSFSRIAPFLRPITSGAFGSSCHIISAPPSNQEPPVHTLPSYQRVEGHVRGVALSEGDDICLQAGGIGTHNVWSLQENYNPSKQNDPSLPFTQVGHSTSENLFSSRQVSVRFHLLKLFSNLFHLLPALQTYITVCPCAGG